MKTIAIDIQPLRCFLNPALVGGALPDVGGIVPELNKNAVFAQSRVLLQSQPPLVEADRNPFSRPITLADQYEPLRGLPPETRYAHTVLVDCLPNADQSLCFHDTQESQSAGLIEWLHEQQPDTLIIGGLALDAGLQKTVSHLCLFGQWDVIVNIAACRGHDPKSSLEAIAKMRASGATIINNALELTPHVLLSASAAKGMAKNIVKAA